MQLGEDATRLQVRSPHPHYRLDHDGQIPLMLTALLLLAIRGRPAGHYVQKGLVKRCCKPRVHQGYGKVAATCRTGKTPGNLGGFVQNRQLFRSLFSLRPTRVRLATGMRVTLLQA